jgi:uncharacterized protein YecE (DUF72 family)
MPLYLGAPVWGLKAWVGNFFPEKSRQHDFLRLYSRRLNSVEGNTTFYSLPNPATLARWVAETPDGFKFCLKFPRLISHHKRLRDTQTETRAFLDCLAGLGDKCGPAFLQLPPSFSVRMLPVLTDYLDALPTDFRYAAEVRHSDFYYPPGEQALDDVLRKHEIARCTFDSRGLRRADAAQNSATRAALERKPDFPVRFTRTASFAFSRFVGHPDLQVNDDLLDEWAGHIQGWLSRAEDVFFFCHVPNDVQAPQLCQAILQRVGGALNLPDEDADDDVRFEQDRLL